MKNKFELTSETKFYCGRKLYRIKALISLDDVLAGNLGGWVEREENLDQTGNAWVMGNACVTGNARVTDDAWVMGSARVTGNAWVMGSARVMGSAWVTGNAWVMGSTRVMGNACVTDNARVTGNADYFCVKGAGSANRNTTFFKCEGGVIRVNCGCFNGTLAEFAEKVHETHGGTMYEREYNAAIELVKIHFGLDDVKGVVKDADESRENRPQCP